MKSLFGFLGLFSLLTTLAQAETLDTSKIEQIIGLKGALNTNEGVFKVTSPRNDVKISVDDWTMLRGHVLALRRAGVDPGVPRIEKLISETPP